LCWLAAESWPAEMSGRWTSLFHPTIQCEDSASAVGRFPNGVEFTLQVSVATNGDPSRFEIFGSAGAVTITGGKFSRYIRYDKDLIDFARTFAGPNPYATPAVQEQPLPEAAAFDPSATHKRFAEAILAKDRSLLLCPAEQGRWSLETICGVYLSHYQGKRIKLPISPFQYDKALAALIANTPMPDRPTQKSVFGVVAATNEKQQGANLKQGT
jgi:predicted dehydrogenase